MGSIAPPSVAPSRGRVRSVRGKPIALQLPQVILGSVGASEPTTQADAGPTAVNAATAKSRVRISETGVRLTRPCHCVTLPCHFL